MQSNRSFKIIYLVFIAAIFSIIFLFGCVSKKIIKVPLSEDKRFNHLEASAFKE